MQVRSVEPEEWRALREVRLRALADAPHAFAAKLADEQAQPDEAWQARASARWAGKSGSMFVAVDGRLWVGMTGVFLEEDRPEQAHLIAMWVDPRCRGRGVGRRLVSAVSEWARGVGAVRVHLWVTETNGPALTLYERTGFRVTGERQPLPSDHSLTEVEMSLTL